MSSDSGTKQHFQIYVACNSRFYIDALRNGLNCKQLFIVRVKSRVQCLYAPVIVTIQRIVLWTHCRVYYYCTVWSQGNMCCKESNKNINQSCKNYYRTSRISTQDMLKEPEWMSFDERGNFHTDRLIHKAYNNLTPSYISFNETRSIISASHYYITCYISLL